MSDLSNFQAECSGNIGGWASPSANATQNGAPYAQGYITLTGQKMLLVNKYNAVTEVVVPNASGSVMLTVDESCGNGPAYSQVLTSDTVTLQPFAVAVIQF